MKYLLVRRKMYYSPRFKKKEFKYMYLSILEQVYEMKMSTVKIYLYCDIGQFYTNAKVLILYDIIKQ